VIKHRVPQSKKEGVYERSGGGSERGLLRDLWAGADRHHLDDQVAHRAVGEARSHTAVPRDEWGCRAERSALPLRQGAPGPVRLPERPGASRGAATGGTAREGRVRAVLLAYPEGAGEAPAAEVARCALPAMSGKAFFLFFM